MERNHRTADLIVKALSAGLSSDVLTMAAGNLCRLRGSSPDDQDDLIAAMEDVIKHRQVEMAIDSAMS